MQEFSNRTEHTKTKMFIFLKSFNHHMINIELAEIFHKMGEILEILDIKWKPEAYYKAAQIIDAYPEDIIKVFEKTGLEGIEEIYGIGEGIGKKIVEYIKTGKIKEYEKLKKDISKGLLKLLQIPGMGPKKVKKLHKELGIETIKDLKKAVKEQKIRALDGFGEKSEQLIGESIELKKKQRVAYKLAKNISDKIIKRMIKEKVVVKVEVAGSLRRKKDTIGDIDILCTSDNPEKTMEFFTTQKEVKRVLAKGNTKSSIIFENIQVDLRIVKNDEWGAALNYFTGSKQHNIFLRQIAISKGLKLSEYGVFDRKTNKKVAGKTEEEVYKKLGLPYIPPKKRETNEYTRKVMG